MGGTHVALDGREPSAHLRIRWPHRMVDLLESSKNEHIEGSVAHIKLTQVAPEGC